MNTINFSMLDSIDFKIISYLTFLSIKDQEFSLKYVKENLELNDKDIFESLSHLWNLDLINIENVSKDIKDLIINFNQVLIPMNIENYNKTSIKILIQSFYSDNEIDKIKVLINDILIPLNLYDSGYKTDCATSYATKNKIIIKNKEKSEVEKQIMRKANSVVEYFYSQLKLKTGVGINNSTRKKEYYIARNFIKTQSKFSFEEIKDAINWFIGHDFWAQYITNISALNKHFIKYIINKPKTSIRKKIKIL